MHARNEFEDKYGVPIHSSEDIEHRITGHTRSVYQDTAGHNELRMVLFSDDIRARELDIGQWQPETDALTPLWPNHPLGRSVGYDGMRHEMLRPLIVDMNITEGDKPNPWSRVMVMTQTQPTTYKGWRCTFDGAKHDAGVGAGQSCNSSFLAVPHNL